MTDPIAPPCPAVRVRAPKAACRVSTGVPRVADRPFTPVVWPRPHTDQLIIVEAITERRLSEVRTARISKPSWVLNGVGEMGWAASTYDEGLDPLVDAATVVNGAGVAKLIGREVQWWRDGNLFWAGPPTNAKIGLDGTLQVGCFDLGWYITRRFFGAAQRKDLLGGVGAMDRTGLPGWIRTGGVTAVRDAINHIRGLGSAALTGPGAITASFTHPTTGLATALPVHLTASVELPEGTPIGTTIMTIEVRGAPGGTVVSRATVVVDEETPLGHWHSITCYALLPPGAPHYVTARLESAGIATTRFDDVRALKNDTTGIPAPGADLATHAIAAMNHFQHGRGQGSFGFRPKVISNTGTIEPMGVRHLTHQQASDWLNGYTAREDGFDWWIDPTRRGFCVAHRRGVDHHDLVLHPRAITSGGWDHDESEKSSKIVTIAGDDGVDRAEGGYTDTSTTGGLYLDYLHQCPDGTPISALDPTAKQVWKEKSQPQITLSPVTVSLELLTDLTPGDRIGVEARSGKFRTPTGTQMRISSLAADLDTEQLEVV